jgi:hypothetical protein
MPNTYEGTMATLRGHAVLADPVDKPADQPTLAYDDEAAGVLRRHLQSGDAVTTERALRSLRGLVGVDHHVSRAAAAGLFGLCGQLYLEGGLDAGAARLAAQVVSAGVASPVARADTLAQPDVNAALRAAVESPDAVCRAAAYAALAAGGEALEAARVAVASGFVAILVARVADELCAYARLGPALTDAALTALLALLRQTQSDALEAAFAASASPPLLEALALPRPASSTLALALACLGCLTGDMRGKRQVLAEAGSVDGLLGLCGGRSSGGQAVGLDTAAAAAGVLMSLLVEDDCKRILLDSAAGPAPLIALVHPGQASMGALISACTALATLAAHPRGRALLGGGATEALPRLRAVAAPGSGVPPVCAKAAQRAVDVITWTP